MTTALLALGSEEFVLLTTFRKTGDPVRTPVWIVPGDGRLLVTTGGTSGKVKRLGHTARIELTPCNARGAVRAGAGTVTAQALVRSDTETLAVLDAALLTKYGLKYRAIRASQRLRRSTSESVALVITAG
ncbi:PPOX class F420-dependent oxidoreductase [Cryobacterium sinapicolor]|uniref:PPOX class F420-dependent oxidoreductase n=1 Tax=Cryobacterium sinapicolor TaxID=1259236 RepID=A0ABY2JHT6_9MICO|nr:MULTISPECIES: PPOX class F420-dependent oxidoreductase [Cryobacterium]TFC92793.1 PPOX class F420-dependent oxidoreductase [Cryobacterium sp. TMT3-29-2]TFD06142.1 PPOX class F420-dependent oxidoreductase [Cryobacterium sinapicolor]